MFHYRIMSLLLPVLLDERLLLSGQGFVEAAEVGLPNRAVFTFGGLALGLGGWSHVAGDSNLDVRFKGVGNFS